MDERLDNLEIALRKRMDTVTGFADPLVQQRELEKIFRHFDCDNSGVVEFNEFFAAMTRLNFVGVQRELEALFDRYDEDLSGTLDYNEFSRCLLGKAAEAPGVTSKNAIERVKARILEMGGANGIRSIIHLLKRMDADGSGSLDRKELLEGLTGFGIEGLEDIPGGDMDKVMQYFDRDGNGRVSIEEFHLGLQGRMPRKRVMLVRQAFQLLDSTGDGVVTVEDVAHVFDTSKHPDVISGKRSRDEVLQDMLAAFEGGRGRADGYVHWHEFLQYYKDLSSAILNDNQFELMMRNAWHMSGGEGSAANSSCLRVLVHFKDGTQQVVEVENDLGLNPRDKQAIITRLRKQGIEAERIELST